MLTVNMCGLKFLFVLCWACREIICVATFVSASVKGTYDHTVVNDELDVAYEKLKGILIQVCMQNVFKF